MASDIDDAIVEWAEAYKQAGDLHLELNVNNAQLEVGMSQAQILAATAAAPTVDIITYYNQVQNAKVESAAPLDAEAVV